MTHVNFRDRMPVITFRAMTQREPVYLSSEIRLSAESGDSLPKKFSGVAYSGDSVSKYGGVVVDIASLRVESDAMPLLFEHRTESYIGNVEQVSRSATQIDVSGALFSDIDDEAASLARKAKAGARYQMSIGVFDFNDEAISPGKSVEVNGRSFAGPIVVLRDGLLREVSIAPLGADRRTTASFFSQSKGEDMDLAKLQADVARLNAELETAKTELSQATERARTLAEENAELIKARDEATKAARLDAVRSLFKDVGKEFSDEAAAPYAAMDEKAFKAASDDLRALGRKAPARLFVPSPNVTGSNDAGAGESRLVANAKRQFAAR